MLFISVLSIYFFVMVVASVYWAAHIRSLNGSSYARVTILLCFAVCFYILGYTMEINAVSASQILFWNEIEYFGIPFVSALWLTIGLLYTGHYNRYKKLLFAAIYAIPFVTMILRFTNDYHHLYFTSIGFVYESGKMMLVKHPGPWMYVQLFHSMLMILLTLGLFIYDSLKNDDRHTGKINLMIAASFFAVTGLLFSIIKPFGLHIDYMAICLPVTCIMVILAILRYDFLQTKSIARSKVFEASRDAILLITRQNKVIDFNRNAKYIFGKVNIRISDGYLGTLFKKAPDLLEKLNTAEPSMIKLHIDTEERYYEISTKGIDDNNASYGCIKTIRDVTETYKLNENLKRLAMLDELSGLSNRRAFLQTGQEWMMQSDKDGHMMHLLMMDLDYFKNVNDQYGHPMGDQVIHNLGRLLKKNFINNSLIARLGGEEFAVLLSGFEDDAVVQYANTVLRDVQQYEYDSSGKKFHVTVSIGVAHKTQAAQSLDNLMGFADKALYQSKDRGRNCVTVL